MRGWILSLIFVVCVSLFLFGCSTNVQTEKLFNYDSYIGENVNLTGSFYLKSTVCRGERDCDYSVLFTDNSLHFSNLSIYKSGVSVICYDEYSKEPRKYLHIVCGLKKFDAEIQRESFEQLLVDLINVKNYNFVLQKTNLNNVSIYYLDVVSLN